MEAYVCPLIGDVAIADVTTSQVINVLTPIWFDKPETARRVRQRMETVFKSALVRGIRDKASPCASVREELGRKRPEIVHHASLPWPQLPKFVMRLHDTSSPHRTMTRWHSALFKLPSSGSEVSPCEQVGVDRSFRRLWRWH
jgi:hypothetical protein